jgi:hypothetical protein
VVSGVDMDDPPRTQRDDDKGIDGLAEQGDDGHEVAGPDVLAMGLQEAQAVARGRLVGDERQQFGRMLLVTRGPPHRQVCQQLAVLGQPDLLIVTALAPNDN